MRHWFLRLLLTMSLVGCAAIGPTNEVELSRAVLNGLPKEVGAPRLFGQATWMPNTKGFTTFRSAFISTGGQALPGVLAITDSNVLFQQWDEKDQRFSIVKKISLDDIKELSLDEYGVNRAIVIQDHRYEYDSFSFTSAAGSFVDASKTVEGHKLLLQMLKK